MQKVYEALQQGREVRSNLIELKQMLKEEGALDTYLSMTEDDELIASLLKDEDAKVRKNAALVLGLLQSQESIDKLWEAYTTETQLFVKSAYLSAMQKLNCKAYEKELKQRYKELCSFMPSPEEQKHILEERKELRRLVVQFDGGVSSHKFTGYHLPLDFILTTLKNYQDTTAVQIEKGAVKIIPMGVQVMAGDLKEALKIRTFRELLFTFRCNKNLRANPSTIAQELVRADLYGMLRRMHEGGDPFYFRIEMKTSMPADKKSSFIKKLAAEIEQKTKQKLLNSAEHYEVEIRLIENRNSGFYPCMKLYTIPMQRFSYRKYTTASSMHPTVAALLVELASSWLRDDANILDAFCGTGTLIMERMYALPVRTAHAVDTFGDAVAGARENAGIAHMNIHFIRRDFMEFTNSLSFDEIWADMPVQGQKTDEEQEAFYQEFFDKAPTLLTEYGRVFLFSNAHELVKKCLESSEVLHLQQEFCIREKDGAYFYIMEHKLTDI